MTLPKIKLFGLLSLSYSLISCGQIQVPTGVNVSPSAAPNPIAQTNVTAKPTPKPGVVQKSAEPKSLSMKPNETSAAQGSGGSASGQFPISPIKSPVAQRSTDAESESFGSKGFIMPSKNIYCVVYGDRLRCEIVSRLKPMPAQPDSCTLDWGGGLVLKSSGKATVLCAGDTAYSPDFPVLAYGETWGKGGYICKSSPDGLTCTNSGDNGFFLNREEWRTF